MMADWFMTRLIMINGDYLPMWFPSGFPYMARINFHVYQRVMMANWLMTRVNYVMVRS